MVEMCPRWNRWNGTADGRKKRRELILMMVFDNTDMIALQTQALEIWNENN